MRLTGHDAIKFDGFLPVYNWIYPLFGDADSSRSASLDSLADLPVPTSRALYVHIPFCETICSFCPFVRTARHDAEAIESYVGALIEEIHLKGRLPNLAQAPVGAVFFGGGTPSVLSPDQIRRIGTALQGCFDLSAVREYSWEFEVKSVNDDRIVALRDIGVTHARFGAQSFDPEYRRLFELTADLGQLTSAAEKLLAAFPHVSCDVLYGVAGQDEEQLLRDIEAVDALGMNNVDFYPINNLMTQKRLHNSLLRAGKAPVSGLTKHYMGIFVREALRARNFVPHNGHGYVRVSREEAQNTEVVSNAYSFVYHEHTLGYPDHDLLGFGVNAISSFRGCTARNTASFSEYIDTIGAGRVPTLIHRHPAVIDASRPLALALPYHGEIPREWVQSDALEAEQISALARLIEAELISETPETYALTRSGWEWYCNVMYQLLPSAERSALHRAMAESLRGRSIEPSGLVGLDLRPPNAR